MKEKTLVFDDWAMYLMENWLEARRNYVEIAHARRQLGLKVNRVILKELRDKISEDYFYLFDYLRFILDYDIPRHQHGYHSYIVMTDSCFESLKRLLYMMRTTPTSETYILPTGYSGNDWYKAERELKKQLAAIGENHFGFNLR